MVQADNSEVHSYLDELLAYAVNILAGRELQSRRVRRKEELENLEKTERSAKTECLEPDRIFKIITDKKYRKWSTDHEKRNRTFFSGAVSEFYIAGQNSGFLQNCPENGTGKRTKFFCKKYLFVRTGTENRKTVQSIRRAGGRGRNAGRLSGNSEKAANIEGNNTALFALFYEESGSERFLPEDMDVIFSLFDQYADTKIRRMYSYMMYYALCQNGTEIENYLDLHVETANEPKYVCEVLFAKWQRLFQFIEPEKMELWKYQQKLINLDKLGEVPQFVRTVQGKRTEGILPGKSETLI